jgi:hypothetical protein
VPTVTNGQVPYIPINRDPRRIHLSAEDASKRLRGGQLSLVLETSGNGLGGCSFMLQPGEEKTIADRQVQFFDVHAV